MQDGFVEFVVYTGLSLPLYPPLPTCSRPNAFHSLSESQTANDDLEESIFISEEPPQKRPNPNLGVSSCRGEPDHSGVGDDKLISDEG